jgi:RNA polymerase sigma factor (sigma-70 family)
MRVLKLSATPVQHSCTIAKVDVCGEPSLEVCAHKLCRFCMDVSRADRVAWLARNILPHEPALRRWLGRRTRLNVLGLSSDDIVQESYARLIGLQSVEHIASPRSYLFQTANSVLLQEIRRKKVVPFESLDVADAMEVAGNDPSVQDQMESREELLMVMRTINALPEKCRQVFILRKIHGLSQREIAQRLQIAESTVEKHLSRGIKKLMDTHRDGGIHTPAASYKDELGIRPDADRETRRRHR